MFSWLFSWFQTPKTSHEKLIKTIEERNKAEALKLIAAMNITELSKVNDKGETALTLAASYGFYGLQEVCEALIPKMSEQAINQVTNDGDTALIWAACKGLSSVCEALIPKMSNEAINAVVKKGLLKGHTELSIAKAQGFKNICDLLSHKMDNKDSLPTEVTKQDETQTDLKLTVKKTPHEKLIEAINSCNKTSPEVIINILKLEKEKQFMIEAINNYNNTLVKELNSILNNNNPNNTIKMIWAVEIYKKLFKEYLTVEKTENFKPLQNKIEDFIKNNFFTAAGVCKNLIPEIDNNEMHISCLPTEIIANIVEYLENEKWGLEVEALG